MDDGNICPHVRSELHLQKIQTQKHIQVMECPASKSRGVITVQALILRETADLLVDRSQGSLSLLFIWVASSNELLYKTRFGPQTSPLPFLIPRSFLNHHHHLP